jgi:hypothetical protein
MACDGGVAARGTIRRPPRQQFALAGLVVEAWPVEHSLLAPAVGYRITAGASHIFYVPDVARLPTALAALQDVDLYVGDGATLHRPLIRRRGSVRIGHATVATQLGWCEAAGVTNAVFTHCGSGIVRSQPRESAVALSAMASWHSFASFAGNLPQHQRDLLAAVAGFRVCPRLRSWRFVDPVAASRRAAAAILSGANCSEPATNLISRRFMG